MVQSPHFFLPDNSLTFFVKKSDRLFGIIVVEQLELGDDNNIFLNFIYNVPVPFLQKRAPSTVQLVVGGIQVM